MLTGPESWHLSNRITITNLMLTLHHFQQVKDLIYTHQTVYICSPYNVYVTPVFFTLKEQHVLMVFTLVWAWG